MVWVPEGERKEEEKEEAKEEQQQQQQQRGEYTEKRQSKQL